MKALSSLLSRVGTCWVFWCLALGCASMSVMELYTICPPKGSFEEFWSFLCSFLANSLSLVIFDP